LLQGRPVTLFASSKSREPKRKSNSGIFLVGSSGI
jgi:hypothetical protein